jgi:1-acyl-sn-glycerol-3-phosphate acyltransferase
MDAWTLVNAWHVHFDGRRRLHGTAHDVLMATPGRGRTGFVKQAIRSGVPIVPVGTVGGHDTLFVVSAGNRLATALDRVAGLRSRLPAKIRTQLLDPIEVDHDPDRVNDKAYVQRIYDQAQSEIQAGMDRPAAKRTLPVLG